MTMKQVVYADMISWILLISAMWIGPAWIIKVVLTVCMMWNMMLLSYLASK